MKKELIIKIVIVIIALFILIGIISAIWYFTSISPVDKNNEDVIEVTIPLGTGANSIADILKDNNIIKNKNAFKLYVKLNNISDFQAGEYYFRKSMDLKEIIELLKTGKMEDPNQLNITYIEGKTMTWLADTIESKTNNTKEDVFDLLKDDEYIDSLVKNYWFLDDVIKNEDIYYPLEGYLFPDTYTLSNSDTSVADIFEIMLDQMEKVLSNYRSRIENSDFSTHEILTIASIIEMESLNDQGRKDVSSVIYNRLDKKMAIQSDVTTYYALQIDMGQRDLYQKEIDEYNPYNTRGPNMQGKLPIGPISSVSRVSIEAALYPNSTDYLFFVADKNGKLYFTKTDSEHNEIIRKLKSEGLWYEY